MEWECTRVRKKLGALRDGEVGPQVSAGLEDHLRGCERCRSEFETMKRLWGLLGAYPEQEVPSGFSQRVVARAEALSEKRRFAAWWSWRWQLAPLSWATAVVFFGGLLMGGILFEAWSARMNKRLASYFASTHQPYEFESSYGLTEQSFVDGYWNVLTVGGDEET
jgi:anti-sigma factor RsiW